MNLLNSLYILNLPNRQDRLTFQKKQLAPYWNNVRIINPIVVKNSAGFASKAVRSCYISHLKIIRKILSLDDPRLNLILEDDSIIPNFAEIEIFLKNIVSLDIEWDMIYLYQKNCQKINKDNSSYDTVDSCLGTYAYVINPKKIIKIYNILKKHYILLKHSKNKNIKHSHIDQVYKKYIHPNSKIITPKKILVHHDYQKFGTDINWQKNFTD